jgi:hypothetical protein
MHLTEDEIENISRSKSENLNLEVKTWINPSTPEGEAKIAKACLAIRNRGGGYFVIGLNDSTMTIDAIPAELDITRDFHIDKLQQIVSKYASSLFEICAGVSSSGTVVIKIDSGIRYPVASKKDLNNSSGIKLISHSDVYFRTLSANGSVSSAKAKPEDWESIADICFENRETDFGRFLRKHLSDEGIAKFISLIQPVGPIKARDILQKIQNTGDQYRDNAIAARPDSAKLEIVKSTCGSLTASVAFLPPIDANDSNEIFLNIIASANLNLTGWPVWLDSRGFTDATARPYKMDGGWQALLAFLGNGWGAHLDFQRIHARGEFYLWRILQDDLTDKIGPNTRIDPILTIIRVAEIIATALSFAKALSLPEDAKIIISLRWHNINGRILEPWANPNVMFSTGRQTHENEIQAYIETSSTLATNAIAPLVKAATLQLFSSFDGMELSDAVYEHWVNKLITRQL